MIRGDSVGANYQAVSYESLAKSKTNNRKNTLGI